MQIQLKRYKTLETTKVYTINRKDGVFSIDPAVPQKTISAGTVVIGHKPVSSPMGLNLSSFVKVKRIGQMLTNADLYVPAKSLKQSQSAFSGITNESLLNVSGDLDLTNTMDFSLSNAEGLDESISNCLGLPYSNMINESLLNADGEESSALTNESLLSVNGDTKKAVKKDEDGVGTKILDFLQSDKAKKIADTVGKLKGGSDKGGSGNTIKFGDDEPSSNPKQPLTILGMHPVTFGLVSVGVLGLAGIVTYIILKRKG